VGAVSFSGGQAVTIQQVFEAADCFDRATTNVGQLMEHAKWLNDAVCCREPVRQVEETTALVFQSLQAVLDDLGIDKSKIEELVESFKQMEASGG
jgi:SOS response regulatory protein OraA/RecX